MVSVGDSIPDQSSELTDDGDRSVYDRFVISILWTRRRRRPSPLLPFYDSSSCGCFFIKSQEADSCCSGTRLLSTPRHHSFPLLLLIPPHCPSPVPMSTIACPSLLPAIVSHASSLSSTSICAPFAYLHIDVKNIFLLFCRPVFGVKKQ